MTNNKIRFITPDYQSLFYLPDGGKVKIMKPDGANEEQSCTYIDQYTTTMGGKPYHIEDIAQILIKNNSYILPVMEVMPPNTFNEASNVNCNGADNEYKKLLQFNDVVLAAKLKSNNTMEYVVWDIYTADDGQENVDIGRYCTDDSTAINLFIEKVGMEAIKDRILPELTAAFQKMELPSLEKDSVTKEEKNIPKSNIAEHSDTKELTEKLEKTQPQDADSIKTLIKKMEKLEEEFKKTSAQFERQEKNLSYEEKNDSVWLNLKIILSLTKQYIAELITYLYQSINNALIDMNIRGYTSMNSHFKQPKIQKDIEKIEKSISKVATYLEAKQYKEISDAYIRKYPHLEPLVDDRKLFVENSLLLVPPDDIHSNDINFLEEVGVKSGYSPRVKLESEKADLSDILQHLDEKGFDDAVKSINGYMENLELSNTIKPLKELKNDAKLEAMPVSSQDDELEM